MRTKMIWVLSALALLTLLPVHARADCTTNQVKLIIQKNELKLTPAKTKCVLSGMAFTISIKPPGAAERGDVTVEEKEGVPLQIDGNNDANADEVVVNVSGTGDPSVDYGYIVHVRGHGMLDPEVRVVSSRLLMLTSELQDANAVLEEQMGLSLEDLIEKQADYEDLAKQAQ